MANYWNVIDKVISEADVLLEVLDARLIAETRNKEIEAKVKLSNKPLIYVVNKSDLADKKAIESNLKRLYPYAMVSAKKKYGTKRLRDLILSKSGSKKEILVGVLGYPNTGKSSIINALGGAGKASTSSQSGHTKGKQDIRISRKLKIIDTPGVIPYMEKDSVKHALTSTIDYAHVKDPDLVVIELMQRYSGRIEEYYGVDKMGDSDETIINIAIKLNRIRKGGEPDIDAASRQILKDWQQGKIKPS